MEPLPSGYAWWYLDALSDDGRHGLTIIGFVGSVFSPYYARARRRSTEADAANHCAINVALYGSRRADGRWSMTERGRSAVHRDADLLKVGPSAMRWEHTAEGATLVVEIDEIAVPFPARLRGTVRVRPAGFAARSFALDDAGRHRWWPIAPHAVVELDFDRPALRWRGSGYLDANLGERPLEADFTHWHWSRARRPDGSSVVLYDVARTQGNDLSLALQFQGDQLRSIEAPAVARLPPSAWRLQRATRADAGTDVTPIRTFEDGPFYARSLIDSTVGGVRAMAVHESLSLDRFVKPWCQWMLPFRMPRVLAGGG
ncbi:MAG: carotenoid 1,2-hydratase [Gammaproteobacteria bacterium]|nr:carotenoid 1,2-hydratase [Gammaproteobacteria bacterium]